MSDKLTTPEMETALALRFNYRLNLIVPNISWGLYLNGKLFHECDLLVLTKAGYLYEVEIKVTKADLVRDKEKGHGHRNHNIKRLYFAVPHYLRDVVADHIPERAGIVLVNKTDHGYNVCRVKRKPEDDPGYKLNDSERLDLTRLGSLRIWTYKRKIIKLLAENKELKKTIKGVGRG